MLVSVASSVLLPLGYATVLGILTVAILNAHQGIPLVVLVFAVFLGLGGYVLTQTRFGLPLYVVGNDYAAARRAGIKVPQVRIAAFAIVDGIAAIAGVVRASRALGVGVFSSGGVGGVTLLESIAVAVIGGISLFGGRGAVHAALLGASSGWYSRSPLTSS